MKEASGELSMTAVAVVAIAAIGVLFTTLIWPNIKNSLQRQQMCTAAYACTDCNGKTCSCQYDEKKDGKWTTQTITCSDPNGEGKTTSKSDE